MTLKISKGLDFPVVALPGVGHMPAAGEDEKEAPRATQRLVIGWVGSIQRTARKMKELQT